MQHSVLAVFALLLAMGADGQTGDNANDLMTALFKTNGYNKQVRPSRNQSIPTQVMLNLYLVAINGIEEVSQKLTTTGFLDIYWYDDFLQWDSDQYGGIEIIYLSQNDIWRPDLSVQNGFERLDDLGSSFIKVIVQKNGFLRWSPFEIFETKCTIDITMFPFDEQTCDIVFVVWSYSIQDVNITKGSKGIEFYEFQGNGEWDVVSTSAMVDTFSSIETKVVFSLTVRRIPTFYLINVIAPVVLLAVLNVFTYVLPVDCGEKMSYSVTMFLSFAVFLSIVSSTLPKTSGSMLEYYLMFQLAMGTLVVIFTSLELRLYYRQAPVPKWVQIVFRLRCFKLRRNNHVESSNGENCHSDASGITPVEREGNSKKETLTTNDLKWPDVVARIDLFMFWFSFLLVVLVTFTIYIQLTV